jgi:integrase
MDDYLAVLTKYVFPVLGDKAAGEITPEELAGVLEPIAARGKHHTAHKAHSALGGTYRWGQRQWKDSKRLVSINPVTTIGFTHQSKRRKRVLSDTELGRLWWATGATESVTLQMRRLIQLAILTGQRNSEVAGMELSELKSLDSATPRWDIPARRMKRKSDDQYAPLSRQAAVIVKQAIADGAGGGIHVFEGPAKGRRDGTWRKLSMHRRLCRGRLHGSPRRRGYQTVTYTICASALRHGWLSTGTPHRRFSTRSCTMVGRVRLALTTTLLCTRSRCEVWADHVEAVAGGAGGGRAAEKVVSLHG